MRQNALNESAKQKKEIQRLVREIVIKRDGTCVLRKIRGCDDEVLQADHLVERSNGATYAETRLIVCVCRGCHGWKHFKKSNHDQYDALIRSILPQERLKLWDSMVATSWKPVKMNWLLEIANLNQELKSYG